MNDFCKMFTGGYCKYADMHVPRDYCFDLCTMRNKADLPDERPAAVKPEKPTPVQMAASFTKAMVKWTGSGFALVSQDEYLRRRIICNTCSGGWRCPKCGCMLWAKAALETETCEKWSEPCTTNP
jgi:hypothetical protein